MCTLIKIGRISWELRSGQTNSISGSMDPTDPVFVESRKKNLKTAQDFLYACKKN